MEHLVKLDFANSIATLTLNVAKNCNTLNESMVAAILASLEQINQDAGIKVLIITGTGRHFCSGGDVKQMYQKEGMFAGSANDIFKAYQAGIQQLTKVMQLVTVPTIAAVNGPAYGAGLDLALMCDIRLAAAEAVFAENFVCLGLISGVGGWQLLPATVGSAHAAQMTFTGEPINADKALAWGLISEVYPADQLLQAAIDMATKIAKNSSPALKMAKQLLLSERQEKFPSAARLSQAAAYQAFLHGMPEHEEAVARFMARR